MRLLHAVASLDSEAAGTTVVVRRLGEELAARGHEVGIGTTGTARIACAGAVGPVAFPRDRDRLPVLRQASFSRGLARFLDESAAEADIVHLHGLWQMPGVYAGRAAGRHGVPLVVSPHGMLGPGALRFSGWKKRAFWALLQRWALDGAACWHATSGKELADIRAFGLTGPVAVVPNGIDVPPLPAPGAEAPARTLLFLGRLHPKKGLDGLLRVWARLAPEAPGWRLRIVGPVEDRFARGYRDRARREGLERVDFDGPLYGEEKLAAYRAAAVFVLPTLDENFGLTVAEALAAGTPAICTTAAPWKGLVRHRCGWWIEPGDGPLEAALRQAIAAPPDELARMGRRGRDWVAADFGWKEIARRIEAVYEWLRTGGEPPASVRPARG